jgi:hypothetical protein
MNWHTANKRRRRKEISAANRPITPIQLSRLNQPNTGRFFVDISAFVNRIDMTLKPLIDAVGRFGKALYDSSWEDYRKAGMPYGNDDNGMMLWFEIECQRRREAQRTHDDYSWRFGLERLRPGYYESQETFTVRIIQEYKCFKIGEVHTVFLSQYRATKTGLLDHCQCNNCVKAREGQELFGMYEVADKGPRRGWLVPVRVTQFV